MDTKSLKKHHFWILLALSVILIPVVMSGTVFGVGNAAVEAKSKIDKRNKELETAAPKCQAYLDSLDKQKKELEEQRNHIWSDVYAAQAGLIHWPARLDVLDSLYFGDRIDENYRQVFRERDVYLAEYERLPQVLAPTIFLDRDWTKVLRDYVGEWKRLPSSEDCWLAVENLCVQREILRDIHAVNQLLAGFLPVPQPPQKDAKPEDVAKYNAAKAKVDKEVRDELKVQDGEVFGRFISPYWNLDLAASRSTSGRAGEMVFRGKLTNISGRRQNVSRIEFNVWLTDRERDPSAPPAVVPVESEFIAAGQSLDFNDVRATAVSRANQIYAVEQKLDLRYAPVKRVDRLELRYLANRYADQTLLPPEGPAFKEAKDVEQAAAQPESAGFGGKTASGGGPNNANVSSNGLVRDRYLHRTEQVRRMPIAVVLVVDQAHVQDVQRAFANSRLRFQNVQIHWQRFRGTFDLNESTSPTLQAGGAPRTEDALPSKQRSGSPSSVTGPTVSGNALSGSPGNFRPSLGRPPSVPASSLPNQQPVAIPDEVPANLVELTVYGIASLYEKYPPRQPQNTAGGTTPPPSPPATPGANTTAPPSAVPTPPPPPPPPPGLPEGQ